MNNIKKIDMALLLGVGLFITGFFNFSHSTYSVGYFYDSWYIFLLVVGGILITVWFLEKDTKK